jgi:hypothetical protein
MMLARTVQPEMLDGLAADDSAALRSRRDLQRIHRVMGTRRILCRTLRDGLRVAATRRPLRILELGAGDGTLLLGVAGALVHGWPAVSLTLLDRQALLAPSTAAAYRALGWSVHSDVRDVADWTMRVDNEGPGDNAGTDPPQWDLIVANLFLHHFTDATLAQLLATIARCCSGFIAVEPRRTRVALLASHLVGALGANAVTREDAVLSVRAGFRGAELGGLWNTAGGWQLREFPAGLFSHVFQAVRQQEMSS